MHPITRAAKVFLAEAEAFWRAEPGRILPMVADPSARSSVVKALRLQEMAPENRRPLFLYEEPFADTDAYFDGLAEAIRHGYKQIRSGAAEEGVTLPPFPASDADGQQSAGPMEHAALALGRAAALLGDPFDGVWLTLVPEQVADPAGWRESIATLDRVRLSSRVRVAVFAPPDGPLQGTLRGPGAHLNIDEIDLRDYLRQCTPTPSDISETGMKLRKLLVDAGERAAADDHAAAALLYSEARAWCAARGRVIEEAMVLMALGGTCLAAGMPKLAIKSYRRAAELAQAEETWTVVCQAWFGVGGAHLASKNYGAAAIGYRAAAETAKRAEVVELRIEALHMTGTCLLLAGAEEGAIFAWQEAIDVGGNLSVVEQQGSSLAQVRAALVPLLKREGARQPFAHVSASAVC